MPNAGFGPLPDLGYVIYDVINCNPQQVIYQRQPTNLKKARYTINSTIWNALSPLDQASLIMHELIYRELAQPPSSHTISEFSRTFNAWINSTEFEKTTLQTYLETLQQLHFVEAQYNGFDILLAAKHELKDTSTPLLLAFNDGILTHTVLDASKTIDLPQTLITPYCPKSEKLKSYGDAEFDLNGQIKTIDFPNLNNKSRSEEHTSELQSH